MLAWKSSGIESFGFDRNDFERTRERLATRFGLDPPESDVLWALWNEVVTQASDPHERAMIYYRMALFRSHEGRDPAPLLHQHHWTLLESERQETTSRGYEKGEVGVEILAAGHACEACQEDGGTVLSLREALDTMPLPNPRCTHGLHEGSPPFCRCSYGLRFGWPAERWE